MNDKLVRVRLIAMLILLFPLAAPGQDAPQRADNTLVTQALENEARAAVDEQHPMRFRMRKSSPRMTTTKEIFETKDGAVARLFMVNDTRLSDADEQKEQSRLTALLSDPARQRHRKQSEDEDSARALKVLRALPYAFLYQFSGAGTGPTGPVNKFTFKPNPKFHPPDLETQVLTEMTGELWIDTSQLRVARLEAHLQQDVELGWGLLGRLNKGGWLIIEQADVGGHQWRVVHFKMWMSGRVLFATKIFDTTEDGSQYAPLPVGLSYKQAIQIVQAETAQGNLPAN
jgi:hypothetical protein